MKKICTYLAVLGILTLGVSKALNAQTTETPATTDTAEMVETSLVEGAQQEAVEEAAAVRQPIHQQIKKIFIDGGAGFMATLLLCFIFGLALSIERIIYLNLATTNTNKLLDKVEEALESGGVEAAKEVCRNTRGPVASIFYQGLERIDQGLDIVEKSIISYGSVQMGLLEKNLSWISLFITVAPMLGFLGTVIGMIMAFDSIKQLGDINAAAVAGPIGVALITTAGGLIVATILQVFYNYLISKIDAIVNSMEDSSITLMDILIKHNLKK
ncbi:MAG: MotA/TolQ/ExbB proton channel family protein [Bacteroidales bacterium]